jgi:hypothetical protein
MKMLHTAMDEESTIPLSGGARAVKALGWVLN